MHADIRLYISQSGNDPNCSWPALWFHLTQTQALWLMWLLHLSLTSATCVSSLGAQEVLILHKSKAIPAPWLAFTEDTQHQSGLHVHPSSFQSSSDRTSQPNLVSWLISCQYLMGISVQTVISRLHIEPKHTQCFWFRVNLPSCLYLRPCTTVLNYESLLHSLGKDNTVRFSIITCIS